MFIPIINNNLPEICGIAWLIGSIFFFIKLKSFKVLGHVFIVLGFLSLIATILFSWNTLQRPPVETLKHLLLWFCLFFAGIGYLLFILKKIRWFLVFNILINFGILYYFLILPQDYNQSFLYSYNNQWFKYYKIVIIVSFALFCIASQLSVKGMIEIIFKKFNINVLTTIDILIKIGIITLTIGIILGGIWSVQTTGYYWNWTKIENWYAATWFVYLFYIHLRNYHPENRILPMIYLILATILPVFSIIVY